MASGGIPLHQRGQGRQGIEEEQGAPIPTSVTMDASSNKKALRLVATAIVFLVVLTCSGFCKLTLFYLEVKLYIILNKTKDSNDSFSNTTNATPMTSMGSTTTAGDSTRCDAQDLTEETVVIWLALIMVIPYVITLTRCVWNSIMNRTDDDNQPTNSDSYRQDASRRTAGVVKLNSLNVLLGVALALLEVAAMAILLLLALPKSPFIGLIVVNSVFMSTVATEFYRFCFVDNSSKESKIKAGSLLVLFLLLLGGLVSTFHPDNHWSKEIVWEITVSLLLLTVSWTPKFQSFTVSDVNDNKVSPTNPERESSPGQTGTQGNTNNVFPVDGTPNPESGSSSNPTGTQGGSTNSNNVSPVDGTPNPESGSSSSLTRTQSNTIYWKLGIITNLVKCAAWAFAVFVCYPWKKDVTWHIVPLCSSESYAVFVAFLINVLCGLFGYIFAILALKMKMQTLGFVAPIVWSNIIVTLLLLFGIQTPLCNNIPTVQKFGICTQEWDIGTFSLYLPVFIFTLIGMGVKVHKVWEMKTIVMEKETNLLWAPGYNSILLDQWLLLTRRTDLPGQKGTNQASTVGTNTTTVFICTTMYHEIEKEMKQVLNSIWDIAKDQTAKRINESKVKFQAHIFFDDGYKNGQVQDFALQLLSIIDRKSNGETSLVESCDKWSTPYGLQMHWKLPSAGGAEDVDGGMSLTLHLKDNTKVKNKKRWSQVMYMSYVLKHVPQTSEQNDGDTYILATDADVKFTPESARALLDLARRDPTVGAVCGRTHPLGSGPMVWYQMFDYAVGHWYQKTANSVLGSVLCCPGCFSVYRAEALWGTLDTYSSGVSEAKEFLMKDMGEDRWLCTLLVSNGWRLEYTAVSEDSTYCPEEFAEFFNQRRRWGPSTVANQIELLEKYFGNEMRRDSVSFLFMVYQGLLFFSGLIGPATCVLIIAGGLEFFNAHNGTANAQTVSITTVVVLSLVSLLYGIICLCTSQKFQLRVAQFLSLCFAVLMTLVLVSLIEDIVVELSTWEENRSEGGIPSVSTLYFLALVGMYVITGLLHFELKNLLYGLVYFLALPTGYILLTLYSVCNLTDRTWGTREGSSSGKSAEESPIKTISDFFAKICGGRGRSNPTEEEQPPLKPEEQHTDQPAQSQEDSESTTTELTLTNDQDPAATATRQRKISVAPTNVPRVPVQENGGRRKTVQSMPSGTLVREWIRTTLGEQATFINEYTDKFEKNGYIDTTFIGGMTDEDLKKIGISSDFHRDKLLTEIHDNVRVFELETAVPKNAQDWLEKLKLSEYIPNFNEYSITTQEDLARLLKLDLDVLMGHLGITSQGHINRLKRAIEAMREPDELEKEKYRVKKILSKNDQKDLKEKENGEKERKFWDDLRKKTLDPGSGKFKSDRNLKTKLVGLRNSALVVLLVVNVLWITGTMILAGRPALQPLGQNPIGFLSLIVFGIVQAIQFFAMLYSRFVTLVHKVARLPEIYVHKAEP